MGCLRAETRPLAISSDTYFHLMLSSQGASSVRPLPAGAVDPAMLCKVRQYNRPQIISHVVGMR